MPAVSPHPCDWPHGPAPEHQALLRGLPALLPRAGRAHPGHPRADGHATAGVGRRGGHHRPGGFLLRPAA
eukprot:11042183-Lingulodinium_polyedra.AAC.1